MMKLDDISHHKRMISKLREQDQAILYELDLQARKPAADIGRRVGLSKETTANRIRALERRGVIGGYNALVNFAKLGRTGYAVFAELRCSSKAQKEKVLKALKGNPSVYWIALLGGRYDLLFAVHAENLVIFDSICTEIQAQLGSLLRCIAVAPRIEVSHFRRDYLSSRPKKRQAPYFGKDIGKEEIDLLDRNILNRLAINGREQLSELARYLDKPRATIQSRVARLEDQGIIQSYYTQIHPERFGFQIYQIMVQTTTKERELRDRFYSFSEAHPNITYFVHAIAGWDFELTVEVPDAGTLQQILTQLRATFPVEIQNLEVVITFDYYLKWGFNF